MLKSNPGLMALLLILGGGAIRLLENMHPAFYPGATPLVALAFIAAGYLPHRWSWLIGVAAVLVSEVAFLSWNYHSDGRFLSPVLIFSLGFYLIMGIFGLLLSSRPSFLALYGGPLLGSIAFYLLANTVSWWASRDSSFYAYPQTWAGWVQANTTGLPGYPPAWIFLRNSLVGDLLFTTLLIMILDPARDAFDFRRKQVA